MNKQIATNIIQYLDRVSITGHQERMIMNEAVNSLGEFVIEQNEDDKETDGQTNSD